MSAMTRRSKPNVQEALLRDADVGHSSLRRTVSAAIKKRSGALVQEANCTHFSRGHDLCKLGGAVAQDLFVFAKCQVDRAPWRETL